MTFRIKTDGIKFQELDLEIDDLADNVPDEIDLFELEDFSRDNRRLSNWWKAVSTGFIQIEDGGEAIPDISTWIGATLFLSPEAYDVLHEHLAPYGEFLGVFIDGEKFNIFNCLEMVDADEQHSATDDLGLPTSLVFKNEDTSGKLIFKTSFDVCSTLYCSEDFKKLVEASTLTGIVFDSNLASIF